jgi:AraC-like DNA-binding protein
MTHYQGTRAMKHSVTSRPVYCDSQFDPLEGGFAENELGVLGAPLDYRAGTELDWHAHPYGQLIYAISGAMFVRTREEMFIVPSLMAVWVPPRIEHSVGMQGFTSMRTVYFAENRLPRSTAKCTVIAVSALLRELILALIARQSAAGACEDLVLIIDLLQREIARAAPEPLLLPTPSDKRVQPIVMMVMSDVSSSHDLREALQGAGVSLRTLERIFKRETGLTFGRWCRQARLLSSISGLAQGKSVTEVALDAGYSTPSAYTYMFRRSLGTAPTQYLSLRRT